MDGIVSRVNTHPEYSGCVAREKYHSLREEAAQHSLDMELEADERHLSRSERREFLKRIGDAEHFLAQNGVSMYSLSRLGHFIESDSNSSGGFRNVEVSFGDFYGVNKETLHYQIRDLVDFLEITPSHPVLRAAQAHVELVRIHPYGDGNGRVARLLQNFCLQQRNYPPAVILAEDKKDYIQLMRNVLQDRVKGRGSLFDPSTSETAFYQFVADRVLASSLVLEQELKSKRIYHVELTKVSDPRIAGKISSFVRNFGRGPNSRGVSVKIDKKNGISRGDSLKVVGDISREDLNTVLEKSCGKYGVKFNVANKFC